MEDDASICKKPELRTLATQKLDEILKDLGISEDESKTLNRWEKVAEISENVKNNDQNNSEDDQKDSSSTHTSIIMIDEVTNNDNVKKNKRKIQKILGIRSRDEVVVQFEGSSHQVIVSTNEMKSKYPMELLNFYEQKYFECIHDDNNLFIH